MLTSAECRERAEQKLAEADLHPRHEKRLRTAAEGWLNLADLMGRLSCLWPSRRSSPVSQLSKPQQRGNP